MIPDNHAFKALIRKADKFLIVSDTTFDGKVFQDLPGGKPEKGETPEETVIREVKEEVGLTVTAEKTLGEYFIVSKKGITHCTVFECVTNNYEIDMDNNPADEGLISYEWVTKEEFIEKYNGLHESLKEFIRNS